MWRLLIGSVGFDCDERVGQRSKAFWQCDLCGAKLIYRRSSVGLEHGACVFQRLLLAVLSTSCGKRRFPALVQRLSKENVPAPAALLAPKYFGGISLVSDRVSGEPFVSLSIWQPLSDFLCGGASS